MVRGGVEKVGALRSLNESVSFLHSAFLSGYFFFFFFPFLACFLLERVYDIPAFMRGLPVCVRLGCDSRVQLSLYGGWGCHHEGCLREF